MYLFYGMATSTWFGLKKSWQKFLQNWRVNEELTVIAAVEIAQETPKSSTESKMAEFLLV